VPFLKQVLLRVARLCLDRSRVDFAFGLGDLSSGKRHVNCRRLANYLTTP
jgi:hypothetical protein